jgi:hypothetical protein
MFSEIFAHVVEKVVEHDGECNPGYVEVICDVLSDMGADMVEYAQASDLEKIQKCANLCIHRSNCMKTKASLRVFEEYNNAPEKNKRVWKRLTVGKDVTSISLKCEALDGRACPVGLCDGDDISLKGTNSRSCSGRLNVELKSLKITVDKEGRKWEILIPRAVIKRRHKDKDGREIPGAGIAFTEWGINRMLLAERIAS